MGDIGTALASAVIFLFAQGQGGQVPIGTAFVIGYPVPGQANQFIPLVVTAKHVIGEHLKVIGRFSAQEGTVPVAVEYDIAALKQSGDYWEHADPGVDIVVFRTQHFKEAKYEPVPFDLVASKADFEASQIQTTDRVVLPGLLVNFMGLTRNYPIVRNGFIAMVSDEPGQMRYRVGSRIVETRQHTILIDAAAIPGQSGSPVFLWPGPRVAGGAFNVGGTKPFILGVLHGYYPALPQEVVSIPAEGRQVYAENSNVAIAFPSWRLREIVESDAVKARLERLISSSR
jgi:hypothetical protein